MSFGFVTRALLLVALLTPGAAAAQEVVVRGRVVGPEGATLAGQRVLLHRVDLSGGATIAEATSEADGHYTLTAPATTDTSAVYFVAGRYRGELYIGPMFRVTGRDTVEQVLHVGVESTSASAMLAGTQQPPQRGGRAPSTNWLLFIVPLMGVAAAVIYMFRPRRRIPPDRALLMRVAEIDERMAGAPPGQRDAMSAERAHLIEQLRTG